ncbi:hypothetical protein GDO78_020066 [Eleutherodactylus coqui]|uniref:Uncharacterized protein n=1 Tax=Eleutherodactylus coqui TaxID=57060 RepID=A0A8J6JZF9_ELECQ|nr:hypothetical protein GDO78_020066 [Eleutherodactylus coqui]
MLHRESMLQERAPTQRMQQMRGKPPEASRTAVGFLQLESQYEPHGDSTISAPFFKNAEDSKSTLCKYAYGHVNPAPGCCCWGADLAFFLQKQKIFSQPKPVVVGDMGIIRRRTSIGRTQLWHRS